MKTVAVPKLTTISGAPKRLTPPIAAATRSAPTSVGFSVWTGIKRCVCGLRNCGVVAEETAADALENRVELGHDAGDRDGFDLAGGDGARREKLREKDAVLVGRAPQFGGDAPRVTQLVTREAAEFGLGVADVDRQEHGSSASTASRRRAASVALSARPSSRRPSSPQSSVSSLGPGAETALAAHVVDRDRIEMLGAQFFSRSLLVLAPFRPRSRPRTSRLCARPARRARRGWVRSARPDLRRSSSVSIRCVPRDASRRPPPSRSR